MYYIAYGSNINLEQMAFRCPHSKVVGVGYLKGWKLYFNYHADIMNTNNENDITPVLIWDIAKDDWKTLDKYEGFPKYYIKDLIPFYMKNKEYEGIVYLMNRKIEFCPPSLEYFETIATGYEENNIKFDCLINACQEALDREGEEEGEEQEIII